MENTIENNILGLFKLNSLGYLFYPIYTNIDKSKLDFRQIICHNIPEGFTNTILHNHQCILCNHTRYIFI